VSHSRHQRAGCFHLVFAGGVLCCRLLFPSAQAAELTSGHHRSFQVEGLEARVNLTSQVLLPDPDLGQGGRMLVPVFYDGQRQKTKVWAFLGWSQRGLEVEFATPRKVEVFKDGKPAHESAYEVSFRSSSYRIAYPVAAEAYVSQVLDREAFRRHCDQYRTQAEILKQLH